MIPALPPARHVNSGKAHIAYFCLGPEAGQAIVLCHGLCANGLQFVDDARFFAGKGLRVIVPDLRGHGRSTSSQPLYRADFSLERQAGDLVRVLDAEDVERVDFVGNSLGGIVALEMIGRHASRLRSLATFGTAYALDVPAWFLPAGRLGDALISRRAVARYGASATSRHAHARQVVEAMLAEFDIGAALGAGAHARHYDLIANALPSQGPLLVIRGEDDGWVNKALSSTLAAMEGRNNFALVDIVDAGHCANLDQPQAVREVLLNFWARHSVTT